MAGNSGCSGHYASRDRASSERPFQSGKGYVGFTLAHEQFLVSELVELGILAEQARFAYLATSDHLQPWQANEGHAGQAGRWAHLLTLPAKSGWERP